MLNVAERTRENPILIFWGYSSSSEYVEIQCLWGYTYFANEMGSVSHYLLCSQGLEFSQNFVTTIMPAVSQG